MEFHIPSYKITRSMWKWLSQNPRKLLDQYSTKQFYWVGVAIMITEIKSLSINLKRLYFIHSFRFRTYGQKQGKRKWLLGRSQDTCPLEPQTTITSSHLMFKRLFGFFLHSTSFSDVKKILACIILFFFSFFLVFVSNHY